MKFADLIGLCVEDESLVLLEMKKLLTEMGFGTVLTAHRLDEAFSHLEKNKIDFAILDYDLGYGELTTDLGLKLAGTGTQVLVSSGYDQSAIDPKLHSFDFLEKPAMSSVLRRRISGFFPDH